MKKDIYEVMFSADYKNNGLCGEQLYKGSSQAKAQSAFSKCAKGLSVEEANSHVIIYLYKNGFIWKRIMIDVQEVHS